MRRRSGCSRTRGASTASRRSSSTRSAWDPPPCTGRSVMPRPLDQPPALPPQPGREGRTLMANDTDEQRRCQVCGGSLDGRRAHARFCGAGCRREHSRVRRSQRSQRLGLHLARPVPEKASKTPGGGVGCDASTKVAPRAVNAGAVAPKAVTFGANGTLPVQAARPPRQTAQAPPTQGEHHEHHRRHDHDPVRARGGIRAAALSATSICADNLRHAIDHYISSPDDAGLAAVTEQRETLTQWLGFHRGHRRRHRPHVRAEGARP